MSIPDKLINFQVYEDGASIDAVVDVTLPTLSYMTDSMSGAGIAGEIDSPTIGHFSSLTVNINMRTLSGNNIRLHAPKAHSFDFRGSVQHFDEGSGSFISRAIRVVIVGIPKSGPLGSLSVASQMGPGNEFEVTYLQVIIDDIVEVEIDKLNLVCTIGGIDYLQDVRRNLGRV